MIVVDASVLVDFLLGRPAALAAVETALRGREQEPLNAPDLIEPESLNALRRMVARGELAPARASRAVADLGIVRLVRWPHAPLRQRVWELRDELTSYDATYLALAEAMDGPMLLTGDRGLAARARAALGDAAVLALEASP